MSDVSISSFMQVLNATLDTALGIEFPGKYMPTGNPVRSEGVTKAQLMSNRQLAEGWYDAIRSTHAREKEEGDNAVSPGDVPELGGGGRDPAAGELRAGPIPVAQAGSTIEEELQAREELWVDRVTEACAQLEAARHNYDAVLRELRSIRKARKAISGKG